jgi:hypothetical protein
MIALAVASATSPGAAIAFLARSLERIATPEKTLESRQAKESICHGYQPD